MSAEMGGHTGHLGDSCRLKAEYSNMMEIEYILGAGGSELPADSFKNGRPGDCYMLI